MVKDVSPLFVSNISGDTDNLDGSISTRIDYSKCVNHHHHHRSNDAKGATTGTTVNSPCAEKLNNKKSTKSKIDCNESPRHVAKKSPDDDVEAGKQGDGNDHQQPLLNSGSSNTGSFPIPTPLPRPVTAPEHTAERSGSTYDDEDDILLSKNCNSSCSGSRVSEENPSRSNAIQNHSGLTNMAKSLQGANDTHQRVSHVSPDPCLLPPPRLFSRNLMNSATSSIPPQSQVLHNTALHQSDSSLEKDRQLPIKGCNETRLKQQEIEEKKCSADFGPIEEGNPDFSSGQHSKTAIPQPKANKSLSCTNNKCTIEKQSSKSQHKSVERLRMKLFLGFMKEHSGKGPEKLFNEYWESIGFYLSSTTPENRPLHSRNDDTIVKKYLTSRSLRKTHNMLILALLRNSMKSRISERKFKHHVPGQWEKAIKIQKARSSTDSGSSDDKLLINQIEEQFAFHSDVWTNCSRPPIHAYCASSELDNAELNKHNITNVAGRENISAVSPDSLPGTLALEPMAQALANKEGLSLSGRAIWFLVAAVREYSSFILNETVSMMKDPGKFENKTSVSLPNNDYKLSDPKTITTQDLARVFGVFPEIMAKRGRPNSSFARLGWERCSHGGQHSIPCSYFPGGDSLELEKFTHNKKRKLNPGIETEEKNTTKLMESFASTTDLGSDKIVNNTSSAPLDGTTENQHQHLQKTRASLSTEGLKAISKGKDLSALRARSALSESNDSERDNSEGNGETTSIERTESSPPPSNEGRGRGLGVKNLSSLRRRSTHSDIERKTNSGTSNSSNNSNENTTITINNSVETGEATQMGQLKQQQENGSRSEDLSSVSQPASGSLKQPEDNPPVRRRQQRRNALIPIYPMLPNQN